MAKKKTRDSIEIALMKMGYRQLNEKVWGKPIGYQLFTIDTGKKPFKFTNHFRGGDGKLHVWQSQEIVDIKGGSYEDSIKYFECYTRTDMYVSQGSDFGFLTLEESLNASL